MSYENIMKEMGQITQIDPTPAGYVFSEEQACYCCKTCGFFMSPDKCRIVSGVINPHGCCNLWKAGKSGLSCCGGK